jgi:hypothetical protein
LILKVVFDQADLIDQFFPSLSADRPDNEGAYDKSDSPIASAGAPTSRYTGSMVIEIIRIQG